MGMRAPVTLNGQHGGNETDWKDVKRRITAALGPDGVYREFQSLGVRFEGKWNSKGKAVCHAMDRPDDMASAFVNCSTGIYHSKGDQVETLNLFDFALKYGSSRFGDWLGTVKHFAELAGVELNARKDGKGRVLEATYDYTDVNGELLYQVMRYRLPNGKKKFMQRRPDNRGGWIYDLDGVGRILYRAGGLIDHPESTVVIVEGEKDADRLNDLFVARSMTAVATTGAQGADDTERWRSYAEFLRGRACVVIPDNDPRGLRHARGVCDYLDGIAGSVKLVELSEVGSKGDVSDWLDADNDVDDLWRLIVEAPAWDPAAVVPEPPRVIPAELANFTELGNAQRLVEAHGDRIRFCKSLGQWYEWDGARWAPDHTEGIWRRTKDCVRQMGREATETLDDARRKAILKWALKSEEKKTITAMIDLARSEPGIAIMPDDLDRDPWMLNCPNGTVDLKTGRIHPHRREDLFSKITLTSCGGECPRWLEALKTIFDGDGDLVSYVRRALGYSLTGNTGEHALFLCYGTGRNGKNTILDTARTILGDYATVANPRMFLATGQGDHPAMLADLMGRRFVPTSEVEEGERLAESLVKRVTGDKTLKARFMRQNPFEFPVLFKLWMLANCKPEIQGRDEGIWSRVRIIPFDVFIPTEKRIKNFSDVLVAEEGPGILRWMVDGCLDWQRVGLAEPARIVEAVNCYRSEQDTLGDYLNQRCILNEAVRIKIGVLYSDYVKWCKENGEKSVLTNRKFGSEMTRRDFKLYESNGSRFRIGIALKDGGSSASDDDDERSGSF